MSYFRGNLANRFGTLQRCKIPDRLLITFAGFETLNILIQILRVCNLQSDGGRFQRNTTVEHTCVKSGQLILLFV